MLKSSGSASVVNIVPAFIPGDGIGNCARARATALIEFGFDTTVICATAKVAPGEFPGMKLMVAGGGWTADASSLTPAMKSAVHQADLLFVEFGCFNICHGLLADAAAPIILFYQGLTPAALMRNDMYTACYFRAIGELRSIPTPSLVLAASQFTLDEYVRLTGNRTSPRRVVPLFGNTDTNFGSVRPRQSFSEHNPLRLLTVGQLFPHKNYEVLVEAVRLLREEGVPVSASHIGGCNDMIGEAYRKRLEDLASPLGNHFRLEGRVSQMRLKQAYDDCDIVVIPSLHEGYSLPAREAMLHGKPVIASSYGALPETLQDTSDLFHPLDARELSDTIKRYIGFDLSDWEVAIEKVQAKAEDHSRQRYQRECVEAVREITQTPSLVRGGCKSSGTDVVTDRNRVEGVLEFTMPNNLEISGDNVIALGLLQSGDQVLHAEFPMQLIQTEILTDENSSLGGEARIRVAFRGNTSNYPHWTELWIYFVDRQSGNRIWQLSTKKVERTFELAPSTLDEELNRLAWVTRQVFEPKCITPAHSSLTTRFKAKIANTVLKLIYHVFHAPQMSIMKSQMHLLELQLNQIQKTINELQNADSNHGNPDRERNS